MITKVGLYHEPTRKRPWLVCWWGFPDEETGKQKKRSRSFKYKREALAFQTAKQAELDSDTPGLRRDDVRLGQLLSEFADARLAALSNSARCGYKNTICQLREFFGNDRLLTEIEQRHAEKFMATRTRRDGRPGNLSSWSMAHHLKHCRAVFDAAIDWGYLVRNPFKPIAKRAGSPLALGGKSGPWHHLTPSEFHTLLSVVNDARTRAMYWLMYGSGLRPGELYNLTRDRIDLNRRRVYIENRPATTELPPFTVKAHDRSSETKERVVPLPEAAMLDLIEATKLSLQSGGFVSLSPERYLYVRSAWTKCRAGLPWGAHKRHRPWENRDMLNNPLRNAKSALRRAGIELTAPFTLTTFRKSFAQNHADNGTPPKTLAKLLGHANVRTTMQYYNRVTDANERAAAARIDELFAAHFHCASTEGQKEDVA